MIFIFFPHYFCENWDDCILHIFFRLADSLSKSALKILDAEDHNFIDDAKNFPWSQNSSFSKEGKK
jgi:hypothetical protein